ncbi:MAG: serine hydroxymethyltransferase [Acholeplasmataceae bacterium]
MNIKIKDKAIFDLILREQNRQKDHIELIASENFTSAEVMLAQGSILTNKYAEGYPNNRYYGGCEVVDKIETLAIERLKQLFQVNYANVQPHSGSQANAAVFQALLKPGDKILALSLNEGGHLTHGFHLNFSGKVYESHFYSLDPDTERLDYDEILSIAKKVKPQLIITGYSAYSRIIDFKKFRAIAEEVGAYLHADIAHIAGLVASGIHPSPIPYAHVVSSTTHKTLRGPRGGIIMTNDDEVAKKVDRAIFPGTQGGPLMHVIAAKAVAFGEALKPAFKTYQQQLVKNSIALSQAFQSLNYRIISGGTENHLFTVDVYQSLGMTGLKAEKTLDKVNITCNKNLIPFDKQKPKFGSGIRLGTAAITTRGLKEEDMPQIANWIDRALRNAENEEALQSIKHEIVEFTNKLPLVEGETNNH